MRFALAAFPVLALAALSGCGSSGSSTPEAAWSVQMEQSDVACTIADNLRELGAVTDTDIEMTVMDGRTVGMNVASVVCSVAGTSTFSVQAQANSGADSLQVTIPSISASASLSNPAPGSVAYESDATADNAYEGDCIFYFDSGMGSAPPIAAGRIWVAFQCPMLQSQMSICPITQGYAVFEDCLTQAEM
jgi:hypothetical protein